MLSSWNKEKEELDDAILETDESEYIKNNNIYYWNNLPSNVIERAEKLCKDHKFCSSLMLTENESFIEVCKKDELTLERLQITRFQIADVLETILRVTEIQYLIMEPPYYDEQQEYFDILDGRYTVKLHCYGGVQPSPFGSTTKHRFKGGCTNIAVKRNSDSKVFGYGELLINLIRYHGFFEGNVGNANYPGIESFRVDPELVVDFFNIKPNVDYSLKYEFYRSWEHGSSTPRQRRNTTCDSYYENLMKILALDKVELPNKAGYAYLSWFTAYFCVISTDNIVGKKISSGCCGGCFRIRNTVNLQKLESIPTIKERMQYLKRNLPYLKLNIQMGGNPNCTEDAIIKSIDDYKSKGYVEYPSLLKVEVWGCLESDESPNNKKMFHLKNVFGDCELETWGNRRHEILPLKQNRRLIGWQTSL